MARVNNGTSNIYSIYSKQIILTMAPAEARLRTKITKLSM
jgi:hypothetical protein